MIGTGQGLGSERDKKRMASPAHDLVQLSLRTLSYLSVPSGRLILLIKVCVIAVFPSPITSTLCSRKYSRV